MATFEVRVFPRRNGYTVVIDGVAHFDARTIEESRRLSREFLRLHVASAFPDRPALDLAGAKTVLRYSIKLQELRRHRALEPPQ